MKRMTVATMVCFAASSVYAQQSPIALNVTVLPDKLEATASLPEREWKDGAGEADVRGTDPKLVLHPKAKYKINGGRLLVLEVSYARPAAALPASRLIVTGIKDARGRADTTFEGSIPALAAANVATGAPTSTGVPTQPQKTEEQGTPNPALGDDRPSPKPSAGTNETKTAQPPDAGDAGWMPETAQDWLIDVDTALILMLLVFIVVLWRKKPPPQPATDGRMAEPVPPRAVPGDLESQLQRARTDAATALTEAAKAKSEVLVALNDGDAVSKRLN